MKQTLSSYIQRVMADQQLSGYQVERRTHKRITQSYINRIRNGGVRSPSPAKLQALAVGELFAVVRGVDADHNAVTDERLVAIQSLYKKIPPTQRKVADHLIEMLDREFERLIKQK